jgi:hypothetical protein
LGWPWAFSGCRAPLKSAIRAYDAADYPASVELLRSTAPPDKDSDPRVRAQYALYRGLAELSVGNARSAERWLRSAWAEADANAETFTLAEYGRLVTAWRAMGRMPAER